MVKKIKEKQKTIPFPLKSVYELRDSFHPEIIRRDYIDVNSYVKALENFSYKVQQHEGKSVRPFTMKGLSYEIIQSTDKYPLNSKPYDIKINDEYIPKRASDYITNEGFTELGYSIFKESVKDIRNMYKEEREHLYGDVNKLKKLFALSDDLQKKKGKNNDCFTDIELSDVPFFVAENIYPPVNINNLVCKDNDGKRGYKLGFLKQIGKSGIKKSKSGYESTYDNKSNFTRMLLSEIKKYDDKIKSSRKLLRDPIEAYNINDRTIKKFDELSKNTKLYIHLEHECNGVKPQMINPKKVPKNIKVEYPALNGGIPIILPKDSNSIQDICLSTTYLKVKNEWGYPSISGMFGSTNGEKITYNKLIEKLNTLVNNIV